MARTPQFDLPFVAAAQAQKHVTVNEALARLDAVAQLRVVSDAVGTPPAGAPEGAAYLVPDAATGDWSAHAGEIAVWVNGGWTYIIPRSGWSMWVDAKAERLVFDGAGWTAGAADISSGGAASILRIVETDHSVSGGGTSIAAAAIPAGSVVIGVSGRVLGEITGTATSWRLGVAGSDNRYGSGLGTAANSYVSGLTGQPQAYYADTDLILTADGGTFSGGLVRLAVHCLSIQPPRAA